MNVDRLSDFIYTRSRLIIAFVVVMNLIALASLTRFAIDTDITGFFTAGNKVYDEYLALTEKYDISESVVVLIEDTESLLAADNMLAVHELVTAIEALPEVREVQSFLPSEYPAGNLMMAVDERFIERHYEVLRDFTRQRHSLADELLSSDEGTGLISITLKHAADGEEVVEKLERIVDRTRGVSISLAGDPVIGTTLEWYLWRIILLLPPAAGSLVLLVFYRMLRNKRLTLLSMLPAAFGTLWTFGTVFLQGEAVNVVTAISPIFILVMGSADGLHYTTHLLEKLSLHPDRRILTRETMRMVLKPIVLTLLSMLPAAFGTLWTFGTVFLQGEAVNVVTAISPIFILVMGSADGLHYTTHLLEKLSLYPDRRILTRETMRMVLKPIVLTSVTTMAGFGSLAWSDLVPLRQMGIYVPLGIGYACFLSVFFLPALLTRIHLPAERPPEGDGLLSFFVSLRRRRRVIFAGVVLLLGIAVINLPQLKVVTDPLLYFKEDSAIRKTFRTVEDTFGGALVIIGEIPATCGLDTLRSADCAESVLDMERELERMPGVLSVRSLFDVVQTAHELQSGLLGYPESPGEVSLILDAMDDDDLASWYSADGIRLVARTSRLDSEDVEALLRFRDAHPELRTLNGTPVLYNEMNRLTVRSQVQSLALALALVFLMLAAGFKEPRAALFALVPIGLTIVAILAALVVTGYNLNMVTATLSAVTVGVGVDYAIHLISGIQYYRAQGLAMADAVDTALFSVSRPVLASAFGLCAGISVMFLSPLHIHSQVATVMWVAMTVSSLGALALIPLFYTIRHCS